LRLAIELDGGQHVADEALAYDRRRTAFLEEQRVRVLRFQNDVFLREMDDALEEIARASGVI
jgi:very-short-patch-repair endonuclease